MNFAGDFKSLGELDVSALRHAVANQSDRDRVHIILDYVIAGEKIRDTKGYVIC